MPRSVPPRMSYHTPSHTHTKHRSVIFYNITRTSTPKAQRLLTGRPQPGRVHGPPKQHGFSSELSIKVCPDTRIVKEKAFCIVYSDDNITVIFDAAEETLFCKILSDRNHLLAPLLPNEVCTPYHLRPRRHNRQLTPKVNKLCDSNFIQCMLYKDSYWLSCILSAFYFTCWAAFRQLIINEYCIVLYTNVLAYFAAF